MLAWYSSCEVEAVHTVQSEILHNNSVCNPRPEARVHINNCPRDKSAPVLLSLYLLLSWFIRPGLLVNSVLNRCMSLP